jgi:RNA polymerase sigma-70 factor (ECF subfamily)
MTVIPLHRRRESTGPSDAELIERALRGDPTAPEQLYFRHAGPVLDTLVRLFGNQHDAEDVLHDAFVIALERLDQLRDRARFRAWLLRTAIRGVYRKERRRRWLSLFVAERAPSIELVAVATQEAQAELAELLRILKRIPIKERAAWSLRIIESYSLPEVADACGCSLATAKRRITAAHEIIRERIDIEEPS